MEERSPGDGTRSVDDLYEGLDDIESEVAAVLQAEEHGVVSDDPLDAVADPNESYVWEIPTGRFTADGRMRKLRVTVVNPGENAEELAEAYFVARNRPAAVQSLWDALVKEPRDIVYLDPDDVGDEDKVNPNLVREGGLYGRLHATFKSRLNVKLLLLLGVDGDFLEDRLRMMPKTQTRLLTRLSMQLREPTDSPRGRSPPGARESESAPTTTS